MAISDTRSLVTIVTHVASDIAYLAQTEIRLAKAELAEKVGAMASGLAFLGVGAVFLLSGLTVAMLALASWIEYAGLPNRWSLLFVAAVGLMIGIAVAMLGVNRVKETPLAPSRTLDQMKEDFTVGKERVG